MPEPPDYLSAALDYLDDWMLFQLERFRQPGCSVAICRHGKLVAQRAYGVADIRTGKKLTPRHHFRIASHSKSITAAAVMLLREKGLVSLDDPIGRYVQGLDKQLAKARVAQLLSHSAGVVRDGANNGQFSDERPFLSRKELLRELGLPQPLQPAQQLKYSNHGYGLLGLMIESITGENYADWMHQHVIAPAGLRHTAADMPALPKSAPFPSGHSAEFPFGQRLIIPGNNACNAIAPAGGFVATAADTALFFAQLAHTARKSILSVQSRREMQQRLWRDPVNAQESHYGLGLMVSGPGPQEYFGHTGSLQGFVSRTSHFVHSGWTISVLTNASDGFAYPWVDGILSILQNFEQHGAPKVSAKNWRGRWWNLWSAVDLVPMGDHVRAVAPVMFKPFDGNETIIELQSKDRGLITRTSGYLSPGEQVRRVRDRRGNVKEIWFAASQMLPREAMVAQSMKRFAVSNVLQGIDVQ